MNILSAEEMFERQARRSSDRTALTDGERHLTYHELERWSRQLARTLIQLPSFGSRPVAVLTPTAILGVVTQLAISRAGGTFAVMDEDLPAERMLDQLDDIAPSLVIFEAASARPTSTIMEFCRSAGATALPFDAWDAVRLSEDVGGREPLASGVQPAYVAFTSGSTGRPKGIVMARPAFAQFLTAWATTIGLEPGDRVAQWAPQSYDAAYAEIFGTLAAGATLCCPGRHDRRDVGGVREWLDVAGVTVFLTVPSFLTELADSTKAAPTPRSGLRLLLVAGETLSVALAAECRRLWPAAQLFNLYGPSESILATAMPVADVPPDHTSVSVGTALDGRTVLVLDDEGIACPPGEVGEIVIRSDHLALGYWRRPAETAAAFTPDPAGTGGRCYRTGDLGRIRADGILEFVGRRDLQIKIRGRRAEPAEIEAAIRSFPGVADVAVTPVTSDSVVTGIAAHVVPTGADSQLDMDGLRQFLGTRLPDYMVPTTYSVLAALPRTRNGKVDRISLASTRLPVVAEGPRERPRSAVERHVAQVFADVLGVGEIDRQGNFFALGGHSLSAARVASRLRTELGVKATVRTVLEYPVVAELAEQLDSQVRPDQLGHTPSHPSAPAARRPLSFEQQRLWFLSKLYPGDAAYNMLLVLRLRGRLELVALNAAVAMLVRRHEVLRMRVEVTNGEPWLGTSSPPERLVHYIDRRDVPPAQIDSSLAQLALDEATEPFDLDTGPVMRTTVVQFADEDHALAFTVHHIAADAESFQILRRDLSELYEACRNERTARLPSLSDQYADYAIWQQEELSETDLAEQLTYWRGQLDGLPVLELPVTRPRRAEPGNVGANHWFVVPTELTERLRGVGIAAGTTQFVTLLTAFVILLSRYSGQRDIAVGVPVSRRNRAADENLIGCYVNTLVFRADLSGAPDFQELLARMRQVSLDAYSHQDLPLDKLVECLAPERDLRRNPLFQAMFEVRAAQDDHDRLGDLSAERVPIDLRLSIMDLSMTLVDVGRDGMRGVIQYRADLFDKRSAESFAHHFLTLLENLADDTGQPVDQVRLLTPAERTALAAEPCSPGGDVPPVKHLHNLFEAQVARTPDAPAIVQGTERLSYGELDRHAEVLAGSLRECGAGPEQPVGLLLEPGIQLVIGLLGILKAGSGYVPLDRADPPDRLARIVTGSGIRLVVTQTGLRDRIPDGVTLFALPPDEAPDRMVITSGSDVAAGNVAYLINTSGSTGQPKAVVVEHGSIARFAVNSTDLFQISPADRVYQFATPTFDTHAEEIYPALCGGACLIMRGPDTAGSVRRLLDDVASHQVTVLNLPTVYWHELCSWLERERRPLPDHVRLVVIGGESASPQALATWRELVGTDVRLLNTYGPTETTVATLAADLTTCVTEDDTHVVPIGRPLPGVIARVLDDVMEPVPAGVFGELYLGGVCLTRGYLRQPAATAENFVPDPFSDEHGRRLFRTGDLVRRRGDGLLELKGRRDDQVKIRGYRVQLGEIENTLRGHPLVHNAAAAVTRSSAGHVLVAFVVFAPEESANADELRSFLAERLPRYMLPADFVALPQLPLTPHGKVDRRRLLDRGGDRLARAGTRVASRSPVEAAVAEVWSEALGHRDWGVEDNLFDLGAHSLMLMKVGARIQQRFGLDISLTTFFERQTVAALARHVEEEVTANIARMPDADVQRLLAALSGGDASPDASS